MIDKIRLAFYNGFGVKKVKKIYLQEVHQLDRTAYVGSIDPRIIIPMAIRTDEEGEEQYQRTLSISRVKDIAAYVGGEKEGEPGILPGSLILGTRDSDILKLQKTQAVLWDGLRQTEIELSFIEFPENPEEARLFQGTLDVMDGQHRLYSFLPEYVKLSEDTPYQISFILYLCPNLSERRMIFRTANENQKPVNGNLLMWFREKLGLLKEVEKDFHPVVDMLNTEPDSPLYGRIIMGDEHVVKGYKAQQVIKIFEKAKFQELEASGERLGTRELYQLAATYLRCWARACDSSFTQPKVGETATKISAIRYMLFLLPTFWEEAKRSVCKFDDVFLGDMLARLAQALQLNGVGEIFSPDCVWSYAFRGEGATVKLAEDHGKILRRALQDGRLRVFNPLE